MWVDEEKKTFSFSLEKALLFKDRFPVNKFWPRNEISYPARKM
jgi:hypothetical protein